MDAGYDPRIARPGLSPLEYPNLCFLGTSVESGSATAVVLATGAQTYFGQMASSLAGQAVETSFDRGVRQFTWLMIRFMAVMVPSVFLLNGLTKHNWHEAFFFSLAVAVGLTPEMLPMIVSVCLSKGGPGHVAKAGHRQAPELDPELRRDERPMHRQDRDPDDGPRHPRTLLRRLQKREPRRPARRFPHRPFPNRPQKRARPRRAPASRGAPRAGARTISQGR